MATSVEPEVLNIIKEEHTKVKKLFREFEKAITSDTEEAAKLSQQIIDDLKLHTMLEESIIYPLLKEKDESIFYEAQEEHHVADVLITELEQLEIEAPSFKAKMMVLRENIEHHIKEEENEMFDKIREVSSRKLSEAAKLWQSQKASATEG